MLLALLKSAPKARPIQQQMMSAGIVSTYVRFAMCRTL